MPFRIGLTGGIASGKSTVADLFRALGVPVLDADAVVHELLGSDREVLDGLRRMFGPEALTPEGTADRAWLRRHVFTDDEARTRLEALLHPRVRRHMQAWTREQDAPYVVLVVPLLLEAGWQDEVDRILVVDAPADLRLKRLLQRPGMDEATARAIMQIQIDDEDRRQAADDLLVNDRDLVALRREVGALHHGYLQLAKGQ